MVTASAKHPLTGTAIPERLALSLALISTTSQVVSSMLRPSLKATTSLATSTNLLLKPNQTFSSAHSMDLQMPLAVSLVA
jgi:hypothetical protein